jgi:hypothetical protein
MAVTDDEARRASEWILQKSEQSIGDAEWQAKADGYACVLAEWTSQELARKNQIDKKLLDGLGFYKLNGSFSADLEADDQVEFGHAMLRGHFWLDRTDGTFVWSCGERMSIFETAGQLRDLIYTVRDRVVAV